jgi:hypothetical protein
MAKKILAVDPELRPNDVERIQTTENNILKVFVSSLTSRTFNGVSSRALRTSVGSFLDHAALVAETMIEFKTIEI